MSKKRTVALTVGAASIAAWAASKVLSKPIPRSPKDVLQFSETIILANQGGLQEAPENTLTAFQQAASIGVHGFVISIRLTKDEQIIVYQHDYVNETTDLTGKVNEFTLAELQEADAAYHFTNEDGETIYRGKDEKMLTLETLLNAFPHHLICIEIQDEPNSYEGSLLPSKLWYLIEQLDATKRVLVFSEYEEQLDRFNLYAQDQVAIGGGSKEIKKAYTAYSSQFGHFYRPQHDFFFTPQKVGLFSLQQAGFLQFLNKLNVPVMFTIANGEQDFLPLIEAGAAGIITNEPQHVMPILQSSTEI